MPSLERQSSSWVNDDDPTGFFVPDEERIIKDNIHDLISINSYLNRFIDTEPFQRLRDIKQLGTSSYVWPSASHSRFEHCLGVAYLARCLASHLQTNQKDLRITNRDVGCVEIAGLCHDLGHGPWSHVWDGIFMPAAEPGCLWQHEKGSEMMFDYLVETYKIPISPKDARFIKALIAGDPTQCDPSEKPFLFDIVANKRNGLDVDKFDYIQRDSHMTGESFSFPATRILRSARVLDDQICYNIKDANQIYRICQRRFELHKHVYNHKTARAIEYMIVDALLLADPHMKIAQRVYNPASFLRLTDFIMNEIEMSRDPALEESRQILKRVRDRDLYRCVDYTTIEFSAGKIVKQYMTKERIYEKAVAALTQCDGFKADDIVVDICTMHHGMKEHNPVDFTKFYHKRDKDVPRNAGPGDYSELRPAVHAEILLRIYTKNPLYYGRVQRGYREVLTEMNEMVAADDQDDSGTPREGTGDTRPATPSLESTLSSVGSDQTISPSAPKTLPKTPGSGGDGVRKRRSFRKIASQNNFTAVHDDYTPVSNPRRPSIGSRDPQQPASRNVSGQVADVTVDLFAEFNASLPASGDSLAEFFDDPPDTPSIAASQSQAQSEMAGLDMGTGGSRGELAPSPFIDGGGTAQALAGAGKENQRIDEVMPHVDPVGGAQSHAPNLAAIGVKRGREEGEDPVAKRRKEGGE